MAASRLRLNMDKTELIWTVTKHNLSKIPGSGRALTLGGAHVAQSDDIHVLGVQLSSDLSLDKHVNVVSASASFIRRSLDGEASRKFFEHPLLRGSGVYKLI